MSLEKWEKSTYNLQNKAIHSARAQLGMDLDDCRLLAESINGTRSISRLSLAERSKLILMLQEKGARVHNPKIPGLSGHSRCNRGNRHSSFRPDDLRGSAIDADCPVSDPENLRDVFPNRLAYWDSKFPNHRPGFASNREISWIQTLWELNFDDHRAGPGAGGLRGFIFRQTQNLPEGPVSDLAFLKAEHVKSVLGPLRAKALGKQGRSHMRTMEES